MNPPKGLFDAPPKPATEYELLAARELELIREWSAEGHRPHPEIDRDLRSVRSRLRYLEITAPKAAPPPRPAARKRSVERVRDGRLAATGEREDDEA